MTQEKQQLARGLVWLGSATALSRITDALGLVFVLRYLTRDEIGLATLAWTVTVFVECFNGLGIGTATLQREELSPEQTASAFWYATGIGLVLTLLVSLAASSIAGAYDTPDLTAMIRVSSLKLVFVGAAAVPLALLGRGMHYKALGAVSSVATLTSSVLTVALAAAGFGAWAPLLGNTLHGFMQLVCAFALCGAFSRRGFDWPSLRPLARTGMHVASSSAIVQLTRNLDYLLLGRLVSLNVLGGYRVAFDLAMAPSIAVLQVGNRAALPVYARLASQPARLAEAWLWTARTIIVITLPVTIIVMTDGYAILALLGKSGWENAELAIRLLCAAAVFRGLAETFPSLYLSAGKSQLSLIHSVLNLALVGSSMVLGLWLFPHVDQVVVIAGAWVVATLLLALASVVLSRRVVHIRSREFFFTLARPLLVMLCCTAPLIAVQPLMIYGPAVELAVDAALLMTSFALSLRLFLGVRLGSLLKPRFEANA